MQKEALRLHPAQLMFNLELDRVSAMRAVALRQLSEMGALSVDVRNANKIEFGEILEAISVTANELQLEAAMVRPSLCLLWRDAYELALDNLVEKKKAEAR